MKIGPLCGALLATTSITPVASAATSPRFMAEANALLATEAHESGRAAYSPGQGVYFPPSDHVFIESALAVNFTYRHATVTLPIFRGVSPLAGDQYYIVTEASDFDVARRMGINYAPKLSDAIGSPGVQDVTMVDGIIHFKSSVDFAHTYKVVPSLPPNYFPPKVADPRGVADAGWSPIVVLPSGLVLNTQIVDNGSGEDVRVESIDIPHRMVTLSIVDGGQGGKEYFYHLVMDASAVLPSVLEKGIYTPLLAKIPAFGKSFPQDDSALLGFSPVLNGRTDEGSGQDQGFSTDLANDIDPINVFPYGPENDDNATTNNYSPLWDAHVSMWTAAAFKAGKVHRILSIDDQKKLIQEGYLTSAYISPPGPGNPLVGGLRPSDIIIDCPVVAHPDLPPQ